ncbi:MoaD/ThiS family protein [Paeniglutamicibacter antarcticus]|uniref:Molybdopterin synthase subunit MoaD2 n=1 Tax=Paeniglutamicibacter antarcticus TaxID=494023 RepID=A0ABP9TS15_9MICC
MDIRYFAAAAQAAGTTEEHLDPRDIAGSEGTETTLGAVLEHLARNIPAAAPVFDGPLMRKTTSLATVLGRCSFLLNGVSEQDSSAIMRSGDTLDVLPPFAGG